MEQEKNQQPAEVESTPGLKENTASALCYVLGFVTGIIFLLTDKRERVRFNAAQSITIFGGLTLINIMLTGIRVQQFNGLIGIFSMILWAVLIYRSYKGRDLRIEFLSEIVNLIQGKNKSKKEE